MAGMFPENQTLELFGESVSWPGVDNNGRFSNGSFSDPAVRPSFIPAETINLILDNLSELIASLGKTPDNTDPAQLKIAVTAALELKGDKNDITEKLSNKVDKITAITAVTTPAAKKVAYNAQGQITATADLAKGDVGLSNVTNDAQVKRGEMGAANGVATLGSDAKVPVSQIPVSAGHPVGSFYTQYPVSGVSDIATMFPSTRAPGTLFGGTWTERFSGEEVFFKGGVADIEAARGKTYSTANQAWSGSGTPGIEEDAIRNVAGSIGKVWSGIWTLPTNSGYDGAFTTGATAGGQGIPPSVAGGSGYTLPVSDSFSASRVVPTDARNHPRNRIIKVFERIA